MVTRVWELYNEGGLREVGHGVWGFFVHDVWRPHVVPRLHSTETLVVGDTEVTFGIETYEDVVRAQGHGELEVLAAFQREITAGDVVWDVGANVGTYSLLAALSGAQAEAFEPGESARARLRRNAELNGVTVTLHDVALSEENGEAVLTTESRSGIRRLSEDGAGDTVSTRRADGIDAPQPDVVKIDVEGAELRVLQGMRDTLADARTVFVEVHDGVDRAAVEEQLEAAGMKLVKEFSRSILKFSSE